MEGEWEKGGGRAGKRWRERGRKVEGEREKGGGRVGEKELGRKERKEQEHKQRLIGTMKTSLNVIQMVDPFWSFSKHTTPTLNTHLVDVFLQYISPR